MQQQMGRIFLSLFLLCSLITLAICPLAAAEVSKPLISFNVVRGYDLQDETVENSLRRYGYRQRPTLLAVIIYSADHPPLFEPRSLFSLQQLTTYTGLTNLAGEQFGLNPAQIEGLLESRYCVFLYTWDTNKLRDLRRANNDDNIFEF